MNTNPKAILFDLDDTIVAWDAVSDPMWIETCRRFAPELGLDGDKLFTEIKKCRTWYLSDWKRHEQARLNLPAYRVSVVGMALDGLGIRNDGFVDIIAATYGEARESAAFILPGAIDTLQHFKNAGTRLALVSNSTADMQRRKIKRFALEQYFDTILIESEFGCGKPDKRVFQHVLAQLKVTAGEAWMVGDNLHFDIAGAKSAGFIRCGWTGRESMFRVLRLNRTVRLRRSRNYSRFNLRYLI